MASEEDKQHIRIEVTELQQPVKDCATRRVPVDQGGYPTQSVERPASFSRRSQLPQKANHESEVGWTKT
jgi:hypothetical protein